MEIVVKNSTDLQPEGAIDGFSGRSVGILYYLNLAFVVLLMLAFILYYVYYYFGINLSLILFFLSMLGMVTVNAHFVSVRRFPLLITALLFLAHSTFLLMIWINNPSNEPIELLKSYIFYFTAIITLVVVYYSPLIFSLRSAVAKAYDVILLVSSIILIVQMIAFLTRGIVIALPWQSLSPLFFRPSGLFGEPAHFGQFSAGLIMLSRHRFETLIQNKWRFAVVLIAILMSFSAFGYVVIFFISLRYILTLKTMASAIFTAFSIILIALVFVFAAGNLPQFQRVNASFAGGGSSLDRINKGAVLFSSLPLSEKFIGVGLGMGERSLSYYSGTHYSYFSSSESYMNAFFSELVNLGLVGAILLNFFYVLLFIRSDDSLMKYVAFMTMRFGGAVTLTSVACMLWLILLIVESGGDL
ncbi:hypothetical protein [Mesotoga sp. UBA5847]|uniref:hypothetical protein n=1 Tax=Mesotoga sp. UBA5847 TaxID=1946859 RepID=UPI0025D12777|nr:hypothetical protein [Mesotoga sp. UBA5847]